MGQEQYGRWAVGLDQRTVARALLAFGIVAADDPSFAMTAGDGLADRLRSVMEVTTEENRERSFSRQLPVAWTDPLALPTWDPNSVGAGASQWAAALQSAYPSIRLTMTVAEASDLVWLTESLRIELPFSIAVSYEARQATPWRFPLRVGFLPDDESRALLAELVAGFGGSSWRSTLIDPFLLIPARVSCDLLVLTGSPWDVPTRLLALQEIRAGAVLVVGPTTVVPGLNKGLIAKIADIANAWAVGFVDVPDIPQWLVQLVQTLSHAVPFDVAVEQTRRAASVLAADPSVTVREAVDQRATRLAQTLNALARQQVTYEAGSPIQDLAGQLAHIAATGQFISEAGDASEIAHLEVQAGELLDLADSARRLQARISPANQPAVSLTAFQPATAHAIEVRIGPFQDADWLAADAAFPEEALEPDRPHELTVVLTEPHLLPVPQVATIDLPVVGTSTTATFTLTTAPDTTTVDARLILLSGNRVLQTARLPAEIGGVQVPQRRAVSEPEVTIAPPISAIADRRTFGAAFLVNRNADGNRRVTTVAGKNVAMVNLSSDSVTAALKKISTRLNEIVDAPNEFGAIDSKASVELLTFLAFHGAKMRTAFVADSPGLAQVLAEPSNCLQVVSAKPDAYFPFEFAYEFDTPRPDDAELCPGAIAALRSNNPLCTVPHGPAVVCPTGFWGLHRVIERHTYQPGTQVTADFLVRSTPTRKRGLIKLGPALFAASHRVDAVVPGGTQAVAEALAAAGRQTQVSLWGDWRTAAADADAPALMMLLPHTAYSNSVEAFGLEIGAGDVEYDFGGCLPSDEHPVIFVLLGCDTALAGELSYETFPAQLRFAGAEVVIATLTEVLGRHASPIASRLAGEIYRQSASGAHSMGEIMLMLRRNLLAEGLLAVLAVASFGDADWLVGM